VVVRIAMKFGIVTHFDPLKPAHDQNFDPLKCRMADSCRFEKSKNRRISATRWTFAWWCTL